MLSRGKFERETSCELLYQIVNEFYSLIVVLHQHNYVFFFCRYSVHFGENDARNVRTVMSPHYGLPTNNRAHLIAFLVALQVT